jgi:hypothetical protein
MFALEEEQVLLDCSGRECRKVIHGLHKSFLHAHIKSLAKPSAKKCHKKFEKRHQDIFKACHAKLDLKHAQNFNKASIGDFYNKYGHSELSRSSFK